MKSQSQLESAIENVKRMIADAQELEAISKCAGADRLLALFNKTSKFFNKAISTLDESSPSLDREYAKCKACLALVDGFIKGIADAEANIELLKKKFLDLNEELGTVMDEKVRREKQSM